MTLLPETRAYLRDWHDWVERGALDGEPYWRHWGLCLNAPSGVIIADLHAAFGCSYPFGDDDYRKRARSHTQHKCPKRLAWVREHML
jgi:hypothetical protein